MEYSFGSVNEALPALCRDLLDFGEEVGSRNGERTMEQTLLSVSLRSPQDRYIYTPGRGASLPAQIAETMWVLGGRDDVAWLRNYLPRAADFSDDGERWRGAYGPRLRNWNGVDQLRHVVELLQADRTSRRAVMSIYDPARDTEPGKDIPCNNWLSFISRGGHLDLNVAIRSNDLIWGWSGINQFEWSALQEIVANLLGLYVGELRFNITSLHVYDRHWGKARRIAEGRKGNPAAFAPAPRFDIGLDKSVDNFDALVAQWFRIEALCREGLFSQADVLIERFPEPMLAMRLRVIRQFWSDKDSDYRADTLGSTAIGRAMEESPVRKWEAGVVPLADLPEPTDFWTTAATLHEQKHAAYGDSWKRRGEVLGIQANIARKVDRIGTGGTTTDETSADTAMDLLIYLIKYRLWLTDNAGVARPRCISTDYGDPLSDLAAPVTEYLKALQPCNVGTGTDEELALTRKMIVDHFENLCDPEDTQAQRLEELALMIGLAHELAVHLWTKEQT
jgi:thymidylate synthase